MKKKFLIAFVCLISVNLFSQTYKLVTVFGDKISETYLSHWKVLENATENQVDTFSLWGYQRYYDSWDNGAYELEYYKGSAKDMYSFINQIIDFTTKYKDEDKVFTRINGVQVKTFKMLSFKYTFVYDKENKVICKFNLNQWVDIRDKFVRYCQKENINIE